MNPREAQALLALARQLTPQADERGQCRYANSLIANRDRCSIHPDRQSVQPAPARFSLAHGGSVKDRYARVDSYMLTT